MRGIQLQMDTPELVEGLFSSDRSVLVFDAMSKKFLRLHGCTSHSILAVSAFNARSGEHAGDFRRAWGEHGEEDSVASFTSHGFVYALNAGTGEAFWRFTENVIPPRG